MNRLGLALAAKEYPTLLGKPMKLLDKVKKAAAGLEVEAKLAPVLSDDVHAAIERMTEHDPGLRRLLDDAYGYAVFPLVGKASVALGVGYGRGEVFERGKLIGYAGIAQLTLGVQVGGQTYDELVVFENRGALERFKSGKLAFAGNVSAVIVKAGAAATTNYSSGTAVFVHPEGGLMFELGLGGQKFFFRRKFLGAPPSLKGAASKGNKDGEPRSSKSESTPSPPHAGAAEHRPPSDHEHARSGEAQTERAVQASPKPSPKRQAPKSPPRALRIRPPRPSASPARHPSPSAG